VRIVYYPDPVLLKPAEKADPCGEDSAALIEGMREAMDLERGVGLAAPQVGVSKRVLLVNTREEQEKEHVLINPEIVQLGGLREWGEEGCLSFPGIWGSVLRYTEVEVSYESPEGEDLVMKAEGFLARVLQHEIDHLDGRIFVDLMRPADRDLNRSRLRELKDRYDAFQAL